MSFSVVIPSRSAFKVDACVNAIRAAGEDCRVIVVNDGWRITPEEQRSLESKYDARIWATDNEGFRFVEWEPEGVPVLLFLDAVPPFVYAKSCNIGIRAADPDHIILLNDDALLVTPGGFTTLVNTLKANPEYGILSPAINNVGNRNQFYRGDEGIRDEPRMLCFSCVAIRREVFERVGLLDERYVNYGMDDDAFSLEARKAGFKLGVYDGVRVDHGTLESEYRGRGCGDYRPNLRLFIKQYGVDNWGNTKETSQFRDLFD
jgi:hypothetical protein